jgi:hypothetical protein
MEISQDAPQYDKTLREWPKDRKALASKVTPQQIADAERLVSEWLQQHSAATAV